MVGWSFEWISLKNKRDMEEGGWGKWLLLGGVFIIIEGNGVRCGRAEGGSRDGERL